MLTDTMLLAWQLPLIATGLLLMRRGVIAKVSLIVACCVFLEANVEDEPCAPKEDNL